MSSTPLDSDYRFIDGEGNLLRSRTELSIAKLLSFLGERYEYDYLLDVNGKTYQVDFKTDRGLIEVLDSERDIEKYREIRRSSPGTRIMGIGHPRYAARIRDLDDVVFYDQADPQTGSIFIEDQSFTFDYAHVLPLVEKCSILHGHTSSVMVQLAGQMKDNLLIDFGEAKRIIRDVIAAFDHKFFVNRRYLAGDDGVHLQVSFDGPKGSFDLRVPRDTAYILEGEATVENLSTEMIRQLAPRFPPNVEAIGVHIYEGYNKGSHIISRLAGSGEA